MQFKLIKDPQDEDIIHMYYEGIRTNKSFHVAAIHRDFIDDEEVLNPVMEGHTVIVDITLEEVRQ